MTTLAELFDALKYRVDVDEYSTRRYYNSVNQLHCDEGPAIVHVDGTLAWHQNGKLHRTDGPAIEYASGTKEWRQNDQLHRTDGPAVVHANGIKEWWLYGVRYTEQAYRVKLAALEQTLEPTT